ncbi:MAG: SDR family NAD(P)-dependent oxidoreductase, partial [Oligoflexales bacterium]|nr:SDR family NAD(P)-dependent oxidoreductase [Oligoflexales bacterium]
DEFALHPSIMDGAVQSVVSLLMHGQNNIGEMFFPFSVKRVDFKKSLSQKCYAYVTFAGAGGRNGQDKKFNIVIADESGDVLVVITEISLRLFGSVKSLRETEREGIAVEVDSISNDAIYARSIWIKSSLENITDLFERREWLIFDNNEEFFVRLKDKSPGKMDILVKPGRKFVELSDHIFEMDYTNPDDYENLIGRLVENGRMPRDIVHMWSSGDFEKNDSQLKNQLEKGVYSLFSLSKAIIRNKIREKINLVYLYLNKSGNVQPQYAAVSGFIKTLMQENPRINARIIEAGGIETLDEILMGEMASGSLETEVKYNHDGRFVKANEEINIETSLQHEGKIREKGVYLITGGAGGLGLIFAENLAKSANARLVLTGRSSMSPELEAKIGKLRTYGCEVVYIKADISSNEEIKTLIKKVKARFGVINGVIHSAGVIKDSLIMKKTRAEFDAVALPKVFGTTNLFRILDGDELDFFVLFSSVSGMFGNPGQCDYSFSNAFMDNFACMVNEKSGKKRMISINWPLWKEGGMKVDDQTEKMLQNSVGMKPLSTRGGIKAFSLALEYKGNHFAVLEGNHEKIRKAAGLRERTVIRPSEAPISAQTSRVNEGRLPDYLKKDIIKIVSDVLKTRTEDIDIDDDMSDYGFDSITFIEFGKRINHNFQIEMQSSVLFEHTSIASLLSYLIEEYGQDLAKHYGTEVSTGETEKTSLKNQKMQEIVPGGENSEINLPLETESARDMTGEIDEQLFKRMKTDLVKIVSEVLKLRENDVNIDDDMNEYGFDSITFVEFGKNLNRKYDIDMMGSVLFEHQTLSSLISYMIDEYRKNLVLHYRIEEDRKPESREYDYSNSDNNASDVYEDVEIKEEVQNHNLTSEPVAVIGMAGVMPCSPNLEKFWENLKSGIDMVSERPKERWDISDYYGDPAKEENKTNVRCAGLMNDIDKFDPMFFGISPREAELMDPQQRLLIETVWKTIEDAGYRASDLKKTSTGVFIGVGTSDYKELLLKSNIP